MQPADIKSVGIIGAGRIGQASDFDPSDLDGRTSSEVVGQNLIRVPRAK